MGSRSKAQTVGFRYFFDLHFALGKAMDGLLAFRASGKTAWTGLVTSNQTISIDAPNLFGGDKGEGGLQGTLDVMFGRESQPVNPNLAAALGGLVPAFRGFAGGFYSGLVTSINPYPKSWEFLRYRALTGWDGAVWYPETCLISLAGGEIRATNPAHILYETYTNREWGRGLDRSMMDDTAFRAAALTLYNEGFGLCLEWKSSTSLGDFRDQVCDHIGAYVGPDRRTGLITLTLIRDDYDVEELPLFDEDSGLLSIEEDEASSSLVAPSQLFVEYTDAITGETRRARAVNSAIAQAQGGPSAEVVSYPGLPTADLAGRVVGRDMRIKGSNLRRFKVRLDRRGLPLAPGSVFRVRALSRGIETIVLRAGRIEDGTLSAGAITITALQDVFGLPASSFVAVPPSGYVPPDRTPQAVTLRRLMEVPYRELAGQIDPANLALLDPTSAWLSTLASKPSGLSLSYTITSRPGTSGAFVDRGVADWCPSAQLVGALTRSATSAVLTNGVDLSRVTVGQAALLDDEIVRVDAIDLGSGAVTLARGCADTVPVSHAAAARIWFYDGFEGVDETEYSSGLSVQARLLTNTSLGQLDPALAGTDTLSLQGRQGRPYAPGCIRINGLTWPTEVSGFVSLEWAHRDHLLQADQLIDTEQGSIGPASGTTYSARLRRADNSAVLAAASGIDGTSTILDSSYEGDVVVELWSVRGGLDSFQRHLHTLYLQQSLQQLIFPLTYDEKDASDTLSLTRSGGAGPHVTPAGFEGDGYSARYTRGSLPSWINGVGRLTLHASIQVPLARLGSFRDELVSLCENTTAAAPRLGLSVVTDPRSSLFGVVAARATDGTLREQTLGRPGWRYVCRTPEVDVGGIVPKPQGVLFLDADTVMMSVHLDDTESRVYKIRLSDGALLGQFSFGTSTRRHIAAFARRSNGDVWCSDYETHKLYRIDLAASFSSGSAVILQTYDTSIVPGVGSIEFMTLSGTEYLLLCSYDSSVDTDMYLYLIDVTKLAGSTFALADRYKRFLVGRRVQGMAARNSQLLVARNSIFGAAGTAGVIGWLEEYNISGMASSLADGATVNATTNATYLVSSYYAPSAYPEDLAVHPVSNEVYTPTEGGYAVADSLGYLALWSSDLAVAGVLNHYTLEYNGSGVVTVKINGHEFAQVAWTLTQSAGVLTIGGLPQATVGFASGFTWGKVANVEIRNRPMSGADYTAITSGSYESHSLTSYALTLTNPGAESGSAIGWTNEVGTLTARNLADRKPPEGTWYFDAGSNAQTVARQRLDLVAQGISATDLDTGALWAKIRWKQAAFDNNDPGGMGLRMLNAAAGTISTTYSGLAYTLGSPGTGGPFPWYPRSFPVSVPTLTRSLDALYNASGRTSGTNNDHYVDAISVVVYRQ